ncbi:MAG TPA: DNA mismatch repair endonuclease MutL, partial [Candidatus Micrarchaeota archaeon]|nr:DNA mismatch repair endonuclease MutL [Candidatus Micrarchaeota archaeon]
DNGSGMSQEDARMCALPHTTSKLSDLFDIRTLGFRGEALASMAAVSRLTITTCDAEGEKTGAGIEICINEGKLEHEKKIGAARGTRIVIEDLFVGTPARKKHLKSAEVEFQHILNIVSNYSIGYPGVVFRLNSDGKPAYLAPKAASVRDRVVAAWGADIAKNLVPVEYSDGFARIAGFLGKPYITKPDRSMQVIFVNGRLVKSDTVSKALVDAYKTMLFLDRQPVCAIGIEIDFSKIDVNVHPQKSIIRIEREDLLYTAVFEAVKSAFMAQNLIPAVSADNVTKSKAVGQYGLDTGSQTTLSPSTGAAVEHKPGTENPQASLDSFMPKKLGPLFILGQANRTYILAATTDGVIIFDQHAVEERVNFEKFLAMVKSPGAQKNSLVSPIVLNVGPAKAAQIRQNIDALERLGMGIVQKGGTTFEITHLPLMLGIPGKELAEELIAAIEDTQGTLEERVEAKIATKACRASIKAGDALSVPQMKELIQRLD